MIDPTSERADFIAGLRALADLLEQHDELKLPTNDIHWHCLDAEDGPGDLATFARLVPGTLRKNTYGDSTPTPYIDLSGRIEGLRVSASAYRDAVCTRRVVAVREVVEEIPDPDALASVPTVTVTKTVEDVEWDCHPILANSEPANA